MELKTRRIVHTGVTKYSTNEWTAQQLREATPWGKGPNYLIRDRDKKYAIHYTAVVGSIKEVETPYRTPEANGVCERFMGSLRRECLDNILIHDDRHLERVTKEYTLSYLIRNDHIKGLNSEFLINMNSQDQSQPADASPRRQYLGDCITAIRV